jgi:hypothetical protein
MAIGSRGSLLFASAPIVEALLPVVGLMIGLLLVAAPATAIEPICPGGSNPRADITKCMDYDNLTHCATGQEDQCWIDNGYTKSYGQDAYGYMIVGGGGATGQGYGRARPRPGSTGSGFGMIEPVPGFPSNAINFRYYVRYSQGYLSFHSGHNVQIVATANPGDMLTCLRRRGAAPMRVVFEGNPIDGIPPGGIEPRGEVN